MRMADGGSGHTAIPCEGGVSLQRILVQSGRSPNLLHFVPVYWQFKPHATASDQRKMVKNMVRTGVRMVRDTHAENWNG